ncbi:MAG TPA: EamA family transporter [Synergistales bacterium]|jgi:drug/metabolite transporter (DMT)-like permease|nr:EamA family transporter [Synergistales bacterium]MDI9393114.1 EamA family transporter [Synergistota bacterium]NLV65320.1 EamA family transporter [Synergistaceae bacterium]HRV70707.1 EamA family transporter [Thermovirgaceae bacterium]MDD5514847.1 EamA family transporter [Synergistales bacterium]
MTLLSLSLLVIAAFLHAGWNLVAKRVAGGAAFTWLFSSFSVLLLFPFALSATSGKGCFLGTELLLFASGSAVFETGYFLFLQRGYKAGDMSVIYPLARGTGPLVATFLAIVVLGERPTPLNLAGTGLVVAGILWIAGFSPHLKDFRSRTAPLLGIATGVCIAGYSLVDRMAVGERGFPPTLFFFAVIVIQVMFLTPLALRESEGILLQWTYYRRPAFTIAFLATSAYLAVLYALSITPLSLIAPAREASIVIGTFLGATVLGEGYKKRRMTGSAIILAGIALLAAG